MHLGDLSIHFCQKFDSYSYSYLVALLLVHVVVVAERTLLCGENSIPALQESIKKAKIMHQRKIDKSVKKKNFIINTFQFIFVVFTRHNDLDLALFQVHCPDRSQVLADQ